MHRKASNEFLMLSSRQPVIPVLVRSPSQLQHTLENIQYLASEVLKQLSSCNILYNQGKWESCL